MARKTKTRKLSPTVLAAIITAIAAILVASITEFSKYIQSKPAHTSTPTPFSGQLTFNAPGEPAGLNPMLEWDAGSSEASSYRLTPGGLSLTAGPHTWPGFPLIRYREPIQGDFEVRVRLDFSPAALSLSTAQMVGLMARPAGARLVLGETGFPQDWAVASRYINDAGSLAGCRGSWVDYTAEAVHLKMERAAGRWRCAYSANSTNCTWLDVAGDARATGDEPVEIALFAYSDTGAALTARFSEWSITRK